MMAQPYYQSLKTPATRTTCNSLNNWVLADCQERGANATRGENAATLGSKTNRRDALLMIRRGMQESQFFFDLNGQFVMSNPCNCLKARVSIESSFNATPRSKGFGIGEIERIPEDFTFSESAWRPDAGTRLLKFDVSLEQISDAKPRPIRKTVLVLD